jgi:hypothetical protein
MYIGINPCNTSNSIVHLSLLWSMYIIHFISHMLSMNKMTCHIRKKNSSGSQS